MPIALRHGQKGRDRSNSIDTAAKNRSPPRPPQGRADAAARLREASLAVYALFVSPSGTCPAAHPVTILKRCGHLWRAWRSGRCGQIRQPGRAASRRGCAEQSEPAGRGKLDPHNVLAVGQANCPDARADKELT